MVLDGDEGLIVVGRRRGNGRRRRRGLCLSREHVEGPEPRGE